MDKPEMNKNETAWPSGASIGVSPGKVWQKPGYGERKPLLFLTAGTAIWPCLLFSWVFFLFVGYCFPGRAGE